MTDTELLIACATAMGYTVVTVRKSAEAPCPYPVGIRVTEGKKAPRWYSPLHDDGQAMMLVKKFPRKCIDAMSMAQSFCGSNDVADFNRVICECIGMPE